MSFRKGPISPEQALTELLLSLFSADELRRFVRHGVDGAEVEAALPAPPASPTSVADEAVRLLRARGDLNSNFFERLREGRPRRAGDIERIEDLFAPLVQVHPVSGHASETPPRVQLGRGRSSDAEPPLRLLRILHLSDLHERAAFPGMPSERAALLELDAEERGYVLGPRLVETLVAISERGVDLVCFTGDLADWGRPEEYSAATVRLEQILALLGVPKERFFAVPGNHDVRRDMNPQAWTGIRDWHARTRDTRNLGRWLRGAERAPVGVDEAWRAKIAERTAHFWDWMEAFGRGDLRPRGSKPLGYRHTIPPGTIRGLDQPIHVVGLDSAWMCGGRDDQGQILVTAEQVRAHIRDGSMPLEGFRVALVHHPLDHLGDHHEVRRLLADNGVDLLLHGHQHVPIAMDSVEPGSELRILAAGCLMEGEVGMKWPNAFNLLEVPLDGSSATVHFHKWSRDGSFWAPGSDLYRQAPGGVLRWDRLSARRTQRTSQGSRPELIDMPAEEWDPGALTRTAPSCTDLPVRLSTATVFPDLPFDLGATWGLRRDPYALLLDGDPDRIHSVLLATESLLWSTRRTLPGAPILPLRWWLRVRLRPDARAPNRIEELLEFADPAPWRQRIARGVPASVRLSVQLEAPHGTPALVGESWVRGVRDLAHALVAVGPLPLIPAQGRTVGRDVIEMDAPHRPQEIFDVPDFVRRGGRVGAADLLNPSPWSDWLVAALLAQAPEEPTLRALLALEPAKRAFLHLLCSEEEASLAPAWVRHVTDLRRGAN